MAAVTSLAVVSVATHLVVMGVRSRLFMRVTVNAGELAEIARLVTIGAIEPVWPGEREAMVEGRLIPRSVSRQMAVLAHGRKPGRCVIRTPGVAVVIGMTTVTIPR
jgi:hypothetical protein